MLAGWFVLCWLLSLLRSCDGAVVIVRCGYYSWQVQSIASRYGLLLVSFSFFVGCNNISLLCCRVFRVVKASIEISFTDLADFHASFKL